MFCSNCGKQLPDGVKFCSGCGNALSDEIVQQPVNQQQVSRSMPASKKEFVATVASPKVKRAALITWITFGLSILFLVLGLNNGINAELEDVPFWSVLSKIEDADLDELEEDIEADAKQVEKMIELGKFVGIDRDDLNALEDDAERVDDKMSVWNILSFYKRLAEVNDSDYYDEVILVMQTVIGGAFTLFFLPLLFAVLGGLLRSRGLTIACLVFAIVPQLVLGSVILMVLTVVALSVQIAMLARIHSEYTIYRLSGTVG